MSLALALPSCLDQPVVTSRRTPAFAILGTCALHAALLGLVWHGALRGEAQHAPRVVAPLELSMAPLPAHTPSLPASEPLPAVAPAQRTRPAARVPKRASPPSAAQAGRVLAAPEGAVDFGETIVSGKGASYAGAGTSRQATQDPRVQAAGLMGGEGSAPNADAARAPRLAGGSSWQCPFPPEADDEGIHHALVILRVDIAADGGVLDAHASSDPGHGFAREARRCAKQRRWEPGLDRAGNPTRASALVQVRFER